MELLMLFGLLGGVVSGVCRIIRWMDYSPSGGTMQGPRGDAGPRDVYIDGRWIRRKVR